MAKHIQDAWRAYFSVPSELRQNSGPIIRSKPRAQISTDVDRPSFEFVDQLTRFGESRRIIAGKWTSASHLASAWLTTLQDNASVLVQASEFRDPDSINDHEALRRVLRSGSLPLFTPKPQLVPLEVALGRVEGLDAFSGTAISVRKTEKHAVQLAFEAAENIVNHRYVPSLAMLSTPFIVRDESAPERVFDVIDQLWIIRAPGSSRAVRLIALQVDDQNELSAVDTTFSQQLDLMLANNGIEVYHAAGWWMIIDPPRVIEAFCDAARIELVRRIVHATPHGHISSYRCAVCGFPMIRSADGYGITEYREHLIHAQCLDTAIDEGLFAPS